MSFFIQTTKALQNDIDNVKMSLKMTLALSIIKKTPPRSCQPFDTICQRQITQDDRDRFWVPTLSEA